MVVCVKLRKARNVTIVLFSLNLSQVSAYRAGKNLHSGCLSCRPRILWRSQRSYKEPSLWMSSGCRSTLVAFFRVVAWALGVPWWQMAMLPRCQAGLRKLCPDWEPQCQGPSLLRSPHSHPLWILLPPGIPFSQQNLKQQVLPSL